MTAPVPVRPELAFITDEPGSNPFSRKSRGLARAFADRGLGFDQVYLRGVDGVTADGLVREIGLGGSRAAYSTPVIARYLRSARPRAAIVNSGQMGPASVLAGLLTGVPVLPWEPTFLQRDLPEASWRIRLMGLLQKPVYPRAPAIVAPSKDMVEWVSEYRHIDRDRVHLLPNPVDIDHIVEEGGEAGPDPDGSFRMIAVGRLVAQKGYGTMIEAMGMVKDQLPSPWKLIIIGEEGVWRGGWRAKMEDQIGSLGLGDNIELAGYLDNPHAEMRRSHLFVHSALWEPFGNVLVEALALGVPVLATDCPGGPREILDGGRYGELVAPDDPAAFGESVVRLASEPGRLADLSSAGPARADRYRSSAIASRIQEILDDVVPGSGPS